VPHPQLVSYITQKLATGASEADIRRELLLVGWEAAAISAAYEKVVHAAIPLPPSVAVTPEIASVIHRLRPPTHPVRLKRAKILSTSRRKKIIVLVSGLVVIGLTISLTHHNQTVASHLVSPSNLPADAGTTTVAISRSAIPAARLNNINPSTYLTTWNFSNLPAAQRAEYYKQTLLPDGTMKREYWITAALKTITLASGITFKAWAYDGQVPGPTLRATEGDTIVVHFTNDTTMNHTINFGGFHDASEDGALASQFVQPGGSTTYSFIASPAGLLTYTDNVEPIAESINEGLYGSLIVDPKTDTRPVPAEDMVMMLNAFDITDPVGDAALQNDDGTNSVYAVNTVAFWYQNNPIDVKVGQLYRIYLTDITNFDQLVTFRIDGNLFTVSPNGTSGPDESYTTIVSPSEGQTEVLDVRFKSTGTWRFSTLSGGFIEKGLSGYFNVTN
jgi:FtsP/CotA-like multicopper oxidase with cupredoxin domain